MSNQRWSGLRKGKKTEIAQVINLSSCADVAAVVVSKKMIMDTFV